LQDFSEKNKTFVAVFLTAFSDKEHKKLKKKCTFWNASSCIFRIVMAHVVVFTTATSSFESTSSHVRLLVAGQSSRAAVS